jgi:hypothetical protein
VNYGPPEFEAEMLSTSVTSGKPLAVVILHTGQPSSWTDHKVAFCAAETCSTRHNDSSDLLGYFGQKEDCGISANVAFLLTHTQMTLRICNALWTGREKELGTMETGVATARPKPR